MPNALAYPLCIERFVEEGGYLACFPDLPGCQTWGETYELAIRNAVEAVSLYIETLIAAESSLPEAGEMKAPTCVAIIIRMPIAV